jgi:hypothetical protein
MTTLSVPDAAGRRPSSATLTGYHADRPPRDRGFRYPADPHRRPRPMSVRASMVDTISTPRGMGRQQPPPCTRVGRWGRPRMKRCLGGCRQ